MPTLLTPSTVCAKTSCYTCRTVGSCRDAKNWFIDNEVHTSIRLNGGPNFPGATNYRPEELACLGINYMPDYDLAAFDMSGDIDETPISPSPGNNQCQFDVGAFQCPPSSGRFICRMPRFNPPHTACDNIGFPVFDCFGFGTTPDFAINPTTPCTPGPNPPFPWFGVSGYILYKNNNGTPVYDLGVSASFLMRDYGTSLVTGPDIPTTGGINWDFFQENVGFFVQSVWERNDGPANETSRAVIAPVFNFPDQSVVSFTSSTILRDLTNTTSLDIWVPNPVVDPGNLTESLNLIIQ